MGLMLLRSGKILESRSSLFSTSSRFNSTAAATATNVKEINDGIPLKGIKVTTLIQRDPIICKELSPFERDYYIYRDNLDRSESRMFHPSFYYKKGTTLEKKFLDMQEKVDPQYLKLIEERDTAYLAKRKKRGEKRFPDLKGSASIVQPTEPFDVASRLTEADKTNNHHDIWRALDRTLFLLVKPKGSSSWQIGPTGDILSTERLDKAAKRNMYNAFGYNLTTWMVGGYPVGHFKSKSSNNTLYFMKSHILAGLPSKTDSIDDLIWVTSDEIKDYLSPEYYESVKDFLPIV